MTCNVGSDVQRAAAILQAGGLVAFATETVYGLGADALNPNAVACVFEVKQRPHFDPLIVHVAERSELDRLIEQMPPVGEKLATAFWPGPLTLVLEKRDIVPDLVTAGLPTVAVRIPSHPMAQQLLQTAKIPIAAPSANPFGRISPTTAAHVADQLGERIDYVLDGGPCQVGLESTVLQLTDRKPVLLRPGGVTVEAIEAVIGPVAVPQHGTQRQEGAMHSPGQLPQHYAPRTRLVMADRVPDSLPERQRVGLLAFENQEQAARFTSVEVLSSVGDLTEAAANFFAALRRLDAAGLDLIVAESFPNEGLGRALNDRLKRAAQK